MSPKKVLINRGGVTYRKHPLNYLYTTWRAVISRCYNPRDRGWASYGGRGIRVALRWHDPSIFVADILELIGPRPSKRFSLDRYPDNDGKYEPGNVRWATQHEQARNTRRNRYLTFQGETLVLRDWALLLGTDGKTLLAYLQKHTMDQAVAHFALHNNPDFKDPDECHDTRLIELPDDLDIPQDYFDRDAECFLNRKGFSLGEVSL